MQFRTINEAKAVVIPALPLTFVDHFNTLGRTVQHGNESSTSKLRKIYALTDKITTFLAPYMVCQKGCSHCCHIDVLITSVEAEFIQKNLGITPNIGYTVSYGHSITKKPCPFLASTGSCSIYDYRPFACRTFFALDNPSFCEDVDSEHVTYTSKSNGLLDKLHYWVAYINGSKPIRDIRDFFPIR